MTPSTPAVVSLGAEMGAEMGAGMALADFVNLGWDRHADEPEALARALHERVDQLPANADGAACVGLAEHLWLAHLHDAGALASWLARVPAELQAQADGTAALAKARWALAEVDAGAAPAAAPSPNARARALQNVWSFQIARGGTARLLERVEAEHGAALAEPDDARCRGLAATCNNLTVELREGPRGDAARDALMLALGEASKRLWARVGTWVHAERAEYQLARCHAVLGQGASALAHARAVIEALQAHADDAQADDFEWFYGWEALAWAGATAGDGAVVAEARAQMAQRLEGVADAELKAWCAQSLAEFDARAG